MGCDATQHGWQGVGQALRYKAIGRHDTWPIYFSRWWCKLCGACHRGCKRVFACDDDTRHHCAHRFGFLCVVTQTDAPISTGVGDP